MQHREYSSLSQQAPRQVDCNSVAQGLAKLLPSPGAVALVWIDQINGMRGGGHWGDPRLLDEAWDAVNGQQRSQMAHTWLTNDGQISLGLVWRAGQVCEESWMSAWRQLAKALMESTIESVHLHEHVHALEHLRQMQQALYEIAELASTVTDLPLMLKRIHRLVGSLMYAENFYVVEYDAAGGWLRFMYFVDTHDPVIPDPADRRPIAHFEHTLTMALIRQGTPLYGPSAVLRRHFGLRPGQSDGPDCVDWLGVPMLRDGYVAGAIVVQSYDEHIYFSDQDLTLLSFVAQHVMTSLDRRQAKLQLESHVRQRTHELQQTNLALQQKIFEHQQAERLQRALFRISEIANGGDDIRQFCAEVHVVLGELIDARNFGIALADVGGYGLQFIYSVDEHNPQQSPYLRARELTEYLILKGTPLILTKQMIQDLKANGDIKEAEDSVESWLGVPLFSDDEIIGAIVVQSYTPGKQYTIYDQRLFSYAAHNIGAGLARQRAQDRLKEMYSELETRVEERTYELAELNGHLRAQIAERLRAEQRLTHQALHDALTGLPNRPHLLDTLHQAIVKASQSHAEGEENLFAVLFLDLDRFKLVNDSVGHAAGDRLLIEAANRIVSSVREEDMVARLGGDEFAILLQHPGSLTAVLNMVERLLDILGQPMWIAGRELFPSGSVGVAMWNPDYRTGEEILRDADAAMYRAKTQRQARYAVFDDAMRREAMRTLDLETDLRRALKQRAFAPFFQPIVRLSDNTIVGYEALLRWNHHVEGYLQPDDFLQLGQTSGLIEQVDWQIYEQVVAKLATECDHGYISVNVSPQHFYSTDFAKRLLGLLDDAGANPHQLRVEITEMALLDDEPHTLKILELLRDRGVLIQLDDFGTGYSALSYLHRFPISALKIDQSFVAGLQMEEGGAHALVRSIIALATTLEIETIAEGIQTQQQRQLLENLGCHYGQGYLLGIPSPNLKKTLPTKEI